jgi:hypothetical protein
MRAATVFCQYAALILNAALKVFWNFGLAFHCHVNNLGRTHFPGISLQWITHVRTSNLKSIIRLFNSSVPTILRQLLCLACEACGLPHSSCCWTRENHDIYSKDRGINIVVGRALAETVRRLLPTSAARVWFQVSLCLKFIVDYVNEAQVFSAYFGFPCQF